MSKILVAFSLILAVFSALPETTEAVGSELFLSPQSKSFEIGDNFEIDLMVNTGNTAINAAQTTVYFPADKLEVISLFKDDSVFTLWPEEPSFFNKDGIVSFAGGLPSPGFQGVGSLIRIEFKAKETGEVSLTFGQSQVLADDGKGTDVLVYLKEGKYFLEEEITYLPQVLSLTHPREAEWYNNNSPVFQWGLSPDALGVSFSFDQSKMTLPDLVSEGKVDSQDYQGVPDGVWYFHLRFEDEDGWGEAFHYKVQIDEKPPRPFEVVVDNGGDPTNPQPNLYFETDDYTSGISHYNLRVGGGEFSKLLLAQINPFKLPYQQPGRHPVILS